MRSLLLVLMTTLAVTVSAEEGASLFRPARVFDGEQMHAGLPSIGIINSVMKNLLDQLRAS